MTKLQREEFITGIVAEEIANHVPAVRVTKAMAKQILKGTADAVEVKVTKDFATGVLKAVESSYARVLLDQNTVTVAGVGLLRSTIREAREYNNPQDPKGDKIPKPRHVSAKLDLSSSFAEQLEALTINE